MAWFVLSVLLSVTGSIILDVDWGSVAGVLGASLLIVSGVALAAYGRS